jgi:hypothetical protein
VPAAGERKSQGSGCMRRGRGFTTDHECEQETQVDWGDLGDHRASARDAGGLGDPPRIREMRLTVAAQCIPEG